MSTDLSISAVRGTLWPTPPQMKQYLDNWVAYTEELEAGKKLAEEALLAREHVLTERIEAMHRERADSERPMLEKISNLEAAALALRSDNSVLREENDAAVRLLAAAVEATGVRLSLLTLINDAVMLVEEAKKQLRDSL